MAKIEVQPQGDHEWWLMVRNHCVMTSDCIHILERAARLLHQARDASLRQAMRILTEQIGMCDDYAEALRLILHDNVSPTLN